MKRAVLYLRVSTQNQTTANQERKLREIAGRMGCDVVKVYKDHGVSGAKGRDKRPAFDKLCRDGRGQTAWPTAHTSVRKAAAKFGVSPGTVQRIPFVDDAGASAAAGSSTEALVN